MAQFQCLLESPFRWVARWFDRHVTRLLHAYFGWTSAKANARRERKLRRDYLDG
ncbi:hypothetical protein M0654_00205 [Rhizobium sp. NTR19]|uniref:Uncharacterized protein n=1 Tax=Neorhizobium turbinariae TaxID=2937795 RepID=A0ABT0IKN5_9HYPH|nr:hypothetical protein [Neorhizobium turbinariae]MCK8778391.1 hypothetical protein [Neorhizobium turbinariae]